jgi:hypothetical protein
MSTNFPGQSELRVRQLDFGWWASNGPTAGYLMRLALEALDHNVDSDAKVRRIDLHVLRLAAAAPFDVNVSTNPGAAGLHLVTVTFGQIEPFAVASLTLGAAERRPPSSSRTTSVATGTRSTTRSVTWNLTTGRSSSGAALIS